MAFSYYPTLAEQLNLVDVAHSSEWATKVFSHCLFNHVSLSRNQGGLRLICLWLWLFGSPFNTPVLSFICVGVKAHPNFGADQTSNLCCA